MRPMLQKKKGWKMRVEEYIENPVWYDKHGQMIFFKTKTAGHQILVDVRGWGNIQNLPEFKKNGEYHFKEAGEFQDKVGQWIVDAINEKLEREKKKP